jgi:aconitate hydratase
MAPMFLGLQAVMAKSFARIHKSNLINFGVLPLQFKNPSDYENCGQGDRLVIKDVINSLKGNQIYKVENITKGSTFEAVSDLNERQKEIIIKGGLLPYTKK